MQIQIYKQLYIKILQMAYKYMRQVIPFLWIDILGWIVNIRNFPAVLLMLHKNVESINFIFATR